MWFVKDYVPECHGANPLPDTDVFPLVVDAFQGLFATDPAFGHGHIISSGFSSIVP